MFDGIHPNAKYRLVGVARLVGMMLVVAVHNNHFQHVKNVSLDTVGTGLLGKMVSLLDCYGKFNLNHFSSSRGTKGVLRSVWSCTTRHCAL